MTTPFVSETSPLSAFDVPAGNPADFYACNSLAKGLKFLQPLAYTFGRLLLEAQHVRHDVGKIVSRAQN